MPSWYMSKVLVTLQGTNQILSMALLDFPLPTISKETEISSRHWWLISRTNSVSTLDVFSPQDTAMAAVSVVSSLATLS